MFCVFYHNNKVLNLKTLTGNILYNSNNKNNKGLDTNLEESKESEVTQLCPTLGDPMDCSLPGSSVHGIFQAIVLEWIAISFSRGSSQPRDWTQVSRVVDRRFTVWATREIGDR